MTRTLVVWLALLMIFCGSMATWFAWRNIERDDNTSIGSVTVLDETSEVPKPELDSFEFTDQMGKAYGSKDLAGKIWIGSFFFADCPQLCVIQNNEIKKVHDRFIDEDDLQIVSISVSPTKDSPLRLRNNYAPRFTSRNDRWRFLTGKSIDYVKQVGVDIFGLPTGDETHTADAAVFDRTGKKIGTFKVTDPKQLAELMTLLEDLLRDGAKTESEPDTATSTDSTTAVDINEPSSKTD